MFRAVKEYESNKFNRKILLLHSITQNWEDYTLMYGKIHVQVIKEWVETVIFQDNKFLLRVLSQLMFDNV